MTSPLFITARFRTGSTLLWNIFHQIPEANAYYEPCHEKLPEMIRHNTPPQATHFNVDTYFREYPPVEELERHRSSALAVYRLYLEADESYPELEAWIQYLIDYAYGLDKKPVFQFNRVDFRLPWLKANFPEAKLIHLYRSPREQWLSSIADYPRSIDGDIDANPYLITTWARDLCKQFPFLAADFIRHPYQRHYYLWKLSYLLGRRIADLSVSYEDLLANPRAVITQLLQTAGLESEANLDHALKIVVQRPTVKWPQYNTEEWFSDLEDECENLLDELDLNEFLATKPLVDIIAANLKYQTMLADPRVLEWVRRSSQTTIIYWETVADEKEVIITELKSVLDDRNDLLERLQETANDRKALADQLQGIVNELQAESGRRKLSIDSLQATANQRAALIEKLQATAEERGLVIDALQAGIEERNETIETLKATVEERTAVLGTLQATESERQKILDNLNATVQNQEKLIAEHLYYIQILEGQISVQRQLIEKLRHFAMISPFYWLDVIFFRRFHDILGNVFDAIEGPSRKFKNRLSIASKPKLGRFRHYPPVPVKIPPHYLQRPEVKTPLPRISIVTPSYNQASFIEQTVRSVLDQDYPRLDYIIQDGASTDHTLAVLEPYRSKLTHIESMKDKGQTNALNLGFAKSSGEIMAYLNSDDLLLPGALHYAAQYFAAHPDVDVIYGHRIIIDEKGMEIGRWVMPPHNDHILAWADYLPQETMFWRRSLWEACGGYFDESFHFAMDWELILRFRRAGARFVRVPRFLGAFRVHSQQKTTANIHDVGQQEMFRLRAECHGRQVTQSEVDRAIQPYIRRHVIYHGLYRIGVLRH